MRARYEAEEGHRGLIIFVCCTLYLPAAAVCSRPGRGSSIAATMGSEGEEGHRILLLLLLLPI